MKNFNFTKLLKSSKSFLGYALTFIAIGFAMPNLAKAEVSDQGKRFLILEAARLNCEDSNPELSEYSPWDTQRRFIDDNWCISLSSANRIDRESSRAEPKQFLFAESSTSNGRQIYIHSYWSYGYIYDYQSRSYEPSVYESWSVKIVDLHIPETLEDTIQQTFDLLHRVNNRDVVLLDAKITPSGQVIEYEVGNSYVFNSYLSDIRAGLAIFNRYSLPLESDIPRMRQAPFL